MPWELGRCSLEAGKRHVDLMKVIWLGTSNKVIILYSSTIFPTRSKQTRYSEEYRDLMDLLDLMSQFLGASLLSRVTLYCLYSVHRRKNGVAAEAVYSHHNVAKTFPSRRGGNCDESAAKLCSIGGPARYTELCRTNWWI
ncbi:hypothetical protein BDR07DRAFT_1384299 [Suillus spraguei]|nr:hypothetical protein BDR07DRAFT_1384299 [Suillus spraguei]